MNRLFISRPVEIKLNKNAEHLLSKHDYEQMEDHLKRINVLSFDSAVGKTQREANALVARNILHVIGFRFSTVEENDVLDFRVSEVEVQDGLFPTMSSVTNGLEMSVIEVARFLSIKETT